MLINWIIEKIRSFFFKEEIKVTSEKIEKSKKLSKPESRVPDKTLDRKSVSPSEPVKRKPPLKKKQEAWNISKFEVPPVEGKTRFHDLNLPNRIMHAIADLGFEYCTPIQAGILPRALTGTDATGQAQTGTGKSAAFLITSYNRMLRKPVKKKRSPGCPRVLILEPTRELVLQVDKDALSIGKYTPSRSLAVFGGMEYEKQKKILQKRVVDIVVATPGRLIDFQRKKIIDLSRVEILVIDEADRMLDMGFIADIKRIVNSTPHKKRRQTLFLSATISPEVMRLASQWTQDPFSVEIEPKTVAAESVKQIVYIVSTEEKFALLYNLVKNLERVLVFANRRDQTRDLEEKLRRHGIGCALLSGETAQKRRLSVLEDFRNGKIRVLVATDVAARGIHVDAISHVINYYLPQNAEQYVHRIGRTGRAQLTGTSISFACEQDSFYIPDIEEFIGNKLECEYPDEELLKPPPDPGPEKKILKSGNKSKNFHHKKKFKKHHSGGRRKKPAYSSQNRKTE